MGSGISKMTKSATGATNSQVAKKAIEKGVNNFEKEADTIWKEIVGKSRLQSKDPVITKILKDNEQDKQTFKDVTKSLVEPSNKTSFDRANDDLNALYAPFGDNRADSIASQRGQKDASKSK